jgi:hypothetical protein
MRRVAVLMLVLRLAGVGASDYPFNESTTKSDDDHPAGMSTADIIGTSIGAAVLLVLAVGVYLQFCAVDFRYMHVVEELPSQEEVVVIEL